MPEFPSISHFRWSSSHPEDQFPVEDPATGNVITTIQGGSGAEVDAAVRAAHAAFGCDWRWRSATERASYLLQAAELLERHADELAELESLENGKPITDARDRDVAFLIAAFRFYGSLVDKLPSEFYQTGATYTATILEPLGVVGAIIPFNWPPVHLGVKLAPALAVGNTVVLKPSEQAPLVAIRIVELLNSVLPAVSIANDTDYGLAAAIYTGDSERAFRVARRLDVGMVLINNYQRGGLTCAGFWHGTGPTGCRLGQRASRAG